MKNNILSFTLIELIVVVIILGILAAIAIPMYTNAVEQRKGDACINNMRAIFAAWRIYNMREATDYATTSGFHRISTINQDLGTAIDERYFGGLGTDFGNCGFYMWYYNLVPWYDLTTYRQSGTYRGSMIYCRYYPNGNAGIYYKYFRPPEIPTIFWPWIPPDE